jgi:hypothetical protein
MTPRLSTLKFLASMTLPGRMVRKKEVCAITTLSPQQLDEEIKAGRFEPGTRLTEDSNILVWWSEYVFGWVKDRFEARGSPAALERNKMCNERAKNAVSHRRDMKNKQRRAR